MGSGDMVRHIPKVLLDYLEAVIDKELDRLLIYFIQAARFTRWL